MYDTYFVNRVLNIYYNRKHFNLNVNTIADIYFISKLTIYNWLNNPTIGNNNERVFNRKSSIFRFDKIIADHVIKNKIIDHNKICNIIKSKFNKNISRKTIYNVSKRNKITHKKVQTYKYPYSKDKFNKNVSVLRKSIKCRKNRIISVD